VLGKSFQKISETSMDKVGDTTFDQSANKRDNLSPWKDAESTLN